MKYKLPFPNAPITEALIDLRVETSSPTSMETLASFHNRIKDRFPKKQERYSWKSEFKVKKDIPPEIVAPAVDQMVIFLKHRMRENWFRLE
jgi:uncharacterized protein (TIGR04255 family)